MCNCRLLSDSLIIGCWKNYLLKEIPMKMHEIRCIQSNGTIDLFSFFFMSLPEDTEVLYRKLCNKTASYDVSMKNFFSQYLGMTINVILIWILFFSLGIPTIVKYGYSFATNRKAWVRQPDHMIVLSRPRKHQTVPFRRAFMDLESFRIVCFS